jgi:hypothetical protein
VCKRNIATEPYLILPSGVLGLKLRGSMQLFPQGGLHLSSHRSHEPAYHCVSLPYMAREVDSSERGHFSRGAAQVKFMLMVG